MKTFVLAFFKIGFITRIEKVTIYTVKYALIPSNKTVNSVSVSNGFLAFLRILGFKQIIKILFIINFSISYNFFEYFILLAP